jgi:hypothetical protein
MKKEIQKLRHLMKKEILKIFLKRNKRNDLMLFACYLEL